MTTKQKEPKRMFDKVDKKNETAEEMALRILNTRAEKEGLPLAERVEFVECEKCGKERQNVYYRDVMKSYCFSPQCDKKLDILKTKFQRASEFYWSFSKIPPALKDATLDNYVRDSEETKRAWEGANYYAHEVSKEKPIILRIHGSNGTGKSHLAVSVIKKIRELSNKKLTCMYLSHLEMLELIKQGWSKGAEHSESYYYKILEDVDILAIDDFGVSTSDFAVGAITRVIDSRSGKPLIMTSNLSRKQLASDPYYARIDSKTSPGAHIIELVSDDFRKKDVKVIKAVKSNEQMTLSDVSMQQKKNDTSVGYDLDNPPF